MIITYIDGSPKTKDSTSLYLLKTLEQKMGEGCVSLWADARQYQIQCLLDMIEKSDAIVIAFPLYVDSIPSHLLHMLEELQPLLSAIPRDNTLYTIVNCGFYDTTQNQIALSVMKLWSKRSGLTWGQGISAGAGGMAQVAPAGYGPSANLGKSLDKLADNVSNKRVSDDLYFEPNFPRFLYRYAANLGWIRQANENHLKIRELHNPHPSIRRKTEIPI